VLLEIGLVSRVDLPYCKFLIQSRVCSVCFYRCRKIRARSQTKIQKLTKIKAMTISLVKMLFQNFTRCSFHRTCRSAACPEWRTRWSWSSSWSMSITMPCPQRHDILWTALKSRGLPLRSLYRTVLRDGAAPTLLQHGHEAALHQEWRNWGSDRSTCILIC
jgi:hypothetical protein